MLNHSLNSSWKSALIGALPFMLWGIALIGNEIPHEWTIHDWTRSGFVVLFFFILFLPSIGFGVAWIQGFPRWSYPYVTLAVIFSLYLTNASTPGITFFGYPTFDRELWGWRAWVPLLIATVASLLISRSLRSVSRLFANVWNDLTLLTLGLFGIMPLLVAIFFDEMDRQYSLSFMVAFTFGFHWNCLDWHYSSPFIFWVEYRSYRLK